MSSSRDGARSHSSTTSAPLRSRGALGGNGFATVRSTVLAAARLGFIPLASAAPILRRSFGVLEDDEDLPKDASDPDLYIYLGVAVILVLLGGVFAGLTIALMGQDETYLQVIATSGEGAEKRHATKVLDLLKKGKHWVLVTLLLSNVITNETLPIVLDRSLGGGWPAVLSSTILIVIFGEVAPQSICVRYGLSIGSFMAPCVWVLMLIMCPVAWPTAKLLDWLLGEDHGTYYKKAGLKTLVQLHSVGIPGERLMEDEVTIINSVLDLKDKPVGNIMTPMQDVFTMSAETVLDEKMMDTILSQGYSRIPIYAPDNSKNYIGMLLVKILITYDPEDCKRVRDFALATLPETAPVTSCLDIINFFQEGKSHMVLVSDFPGQDKGAMGVVTLEDVIEELIGEEIIDESDVFVDVHKAIRRMAPAPRTRYNKNGIITQPIDPDQMSTMDDKSDREDTPLLNQDQKAASERKPSLTNGGTTFLMRRKSSTAGDDPQAAVKPTAVRSNSMDVRKHLSHLGPSNAASKPRATKFQSVKIKPGVGTIPESRATTTGEDSGQLLNAPGSNAVDGGEGVGLLKSAGKDASDGIKDLPATYGTMSSSPTPSNHMTKNEEESIADTVGSPKNRPMTAQEASQMAEENTHQPPAEESHPKSPGNTARDNRFLSPYQNTSKMVIGSSENVAADDEEGDTVGEMDSSNRERSKSRRAARSGSITETTVDLNGMKKVVLEANSSSSEENENEQETGTSRVNSADALSGQKDGAGNGGQASGGSGQDGGADDGQKKKSKKKRGGKKKKGSKGAGNGEGA